MIKIRSIAYNDNSKTDALEVE